jgi:hypothetical protein
MPEEKKEEGNPLSKGLANGLIWAIIFAIIGVCLSFFSIIDAPAVGVSGMAALGISGAVFGFGLGFLYGFFPKNLKFLAIIIIILAIILVVYWLSTEARVSGGLFGEYLHPISMRMEGMGDFFSGFREYTYCFGNDPRCPFIKMWEDPKVESSQERIEVKVSFSNDRVVNDNINLVVNLNVRNPEPESIEVFPKCFLGLEKEEQLQVVNPGSYWQGDRFVFPSSQNQMTTSYRCFGSTDKLSETVYVIHERPVEVVTVWPIKIKNQVENDDYEGTIRSQMTYNAPYYVSLSSNNQIPFEQGKDYDFNIIIKRKERDVELKHLESMSLVSQSEVYLDCEGFEGTVLQDLSHDELKQIAQHEKTNDAFRFLCSLYVADAPENAIISPITANTRYIVESEHKKLISQQI